MKNGKSKSFVSNVIVILAAQMIIKLLGMVYRTVITNIDGFGDAGNGFYSAGFQIYTLLLAVSSVGIPNAVAKLISERTALNDRDGTHKIFLSSLCIFSVIGAVLSAALFAFSAPIAKYVLEMDGASYTIAALSPSIFFVCVSSVFRGYFSGTNDMRTMSASQIIEQVFKSVLTVVFVLISVGSAAEIMSAYANFATTVATVFGALYLVIAYGRTGAAHGARLSRSEFLPVAKKILVIAVPISLCSVISAINRIVDTATITRGIETAFGFCIPAQMGGSAVLMPNDAQLEAEAVRLAGMLSKSDTLVNLPLALNIALATVLVPSISKCAAGGERRTINKYIKNSFAASVALIVPCAAVYVFFSRQIYALLYPRAPYGYELLSLSAVSMIFTALNQTMTGALQGMGKVRVPAIALAVGCVLKVLVNTALIRVPQINIYGAVIGSIVCQAAAFAVELQSLLRLRKGAAK